MITSRGLEVDLQEKFRAIPLKAKSPEEMDPLAWEDSYDAAVDAAAEFVYDGVISEFYIQKAYIHGEKA